MGELLKQGVIIIIIILFFIPGFISIKIWSFIIPSKDKKATDYMLEAISYSCINYAVFSWVLYLVYKHLLHNGKYCFLAILIWLLVLFIAPIIWPCLFYKLSNTEWYRRKFINLAPTSWDGFFGRREVCFVLIHLKNGNFVGGLYNEDSYSSTFPMNRDIYIEQVWKVDDAGVFINKIDGTKGLWISKDFFDYIEFFEANTEEELDEKKQ